MPIGYVFWLFFILWFVFGMWWHWPATNERSAFIPLGGNLLLFILIFLLGWQTFGFIVK